MINNSCHKPSTINNRLILVGTNHKSSPIEARERISFFKKRIKDALNFLKQSWALEGAVILSTCNRVEIYASTKYLNQTKSQILDFISRYHEIDKARLSPYLYIYKEKEAIRHLFQVTSGLDSQILGEVQILGQVKFSLEEARSVNFAHEILMKIFNSAISFAKEIHKSTKILEGKVSVGTVALDFIKQKVGTLSGKNILIIGIGKVSELVLKYLKEENPSVVFVSNRTFQKALELATQIEAKAVKFDDLKNYLPRADVIISATASPHFVIRKETVKEALSHKPSTINHKLLILDLALPRDVDPKVREIENVELFNLEDLSSIVQKNLEKKRLEVEKIEKLINQEVEELWSRMQNYKEELLRDPEVSLKK